MRPRAISISEESTLKTEQSAGGVESSEAILWDNDARGGSKDGDVVDRPSTKPAEARPSGSGRPTETMRIAKAMARAGLCSRREAERMIAAGRVAIDGKVLKTPAVTVPPGATITVDGEVLASPERTRLFCYHKPAGMLTTERDPQGRPTIYDDMPKGLPRLMPVGRLDFNSEGLLLLTNDGGLKRQLELPATGCAGMAQVAYATRADALVSVTREALDSASHVGQSTRSGTTAQTGFSGRSGVM